MIHVETFSRWLIGKSNQQFAKIPTWNHTRSRLSWLPLVQSKAFNANFDVIYNQIEYTNIGSRTVISASKKLELTREHI
jgi:hypothetical protein